MDNILRGSLAFKGERGYSAYEVAVLNGFKGTVEEWLALLAVTEKYANLLGAVRTELNSKIQGLTGGTPLTASSTSGMTNTGRIYVNTTDGNWYYHNGTAWVSGGVYQTAEDSDTVNALKEEVADKVSFEKTVFFETGKNKFNPNDENIINGGYYNSSNVYVEAANYHQTGFIPVEAGKNYTSTYKGAFVSWFDRYKNFIGFSDSQDFTKNGYVTAPLNACYGRFLATDAYWSNLQIEEGTENTDYEKYYALIKSEFLEQGKIDTKDTTFFKIGKNKFNPNDKDIIDGGYHNKQNELVLDANYHETGYIPVEAGKNYTSTYKGALVSWFNSNKKFIGYTDSHDFATNGYVTAPDDAAYAKFVSTDAYWAKLQVEEGTTSTQYEKYKEYIPAENIENATDLSDLKFTGYGDSIVYRNMWQPYLESYFGFKAENLGIGSTTMAYVETVESDYPCMVNANRIEGVKASNPDILAIMGGTNDAHRKVAIGTDAEFTKPLAEKDITTFKGAYSFLIETLLTWKPTLKIVMLTLMHSTYENSSINYDDYSQAIRDIARYYAIPVADLSLESGISKFDYSTYTTDGLHPNEAGGKNIANIVIKKITDLFHII